MKTNNKKKDKTGSSRSSLLSINYFLLTRHAKRGFTLIEAIVYSGLLALFLSASVAFSSSILGTNNQILERNESVANLEFLDKKFAWALGQSTSVTAPSASATGNILTLTGSDGSIFPATFTITDNQITLSNVGGTAVPVTN